jgi:hypothetical protein
MLNTPLGFVALLDLARVAVLVVAVALAVAAFLLTYRRGAPRTVDLFLLAASILLCAVVALWPDPWRPASALNYLVLLPAVPAGTGLYLGAAASARHDATSQVAVARRARFLAAVTVLLALPGIAIILLRSFA